MPGTLRTFQVGITPQRIESFMVQNTSFMLVNPDIVNNIFIGNDPGSQVIAVPALGSITLNDDQHDVWISTNGGNYTVTAYLMPNGSNWVPSPAQVAAQINALGLAKDSTLQTTNSNTNSTAINTGSFGMLGILNGSLGPSALISGSGRSIAQDMKNANSAVTTEIAALLASGAPGGTPGGIPLLRFTNNIGANAGGQTLTPGLGTNLITKAAINQPGYEALFSLSMGAGVGTNPFMTLIFNWFDSTTGVNVKSVFFILTAGNGAANALQFYINGPCYGNQLTINATNLDGAQNMALVWGINQTSHVFATDKITQPVYASTAPITFTNPSGVPGLGILQYSRPTIALSSSVSRLVAVYSGSAILGVDNAGGAATIWVSLQDPSQLYQSISTSPRMQPFVVASGANLVASVSMPRGPMLLTIENKSTTSSVTPSVTLTAVDY